MATHSEQQKSNQSPAIQAQAPKKPTSTRGFAAMDAEKHKRVSAQGGRASQQTQQGARHAAQTENNVEGDIADKNKQESSTESASSNRSGSNQSTGPDGSVPSFPSEEWDQNRSQQSGVEK